MIHTAGRTLLFDRSWGWVLITIFCGLPVMRWLMVDDIGTSFSNLNSSLSSLGQLTGILGFVLYAINMVLSVRTRWLETLFGGLNRVYVAHHIVGGLAFIFILFHPVFLAVRFIELTTLSTLRDAGDFLLPRMVQLDESRFIIQESLAINSGIVSFLLTLGLLLVTFFITLPYRVWLLTHKFLGAAFFFGGLHVLFVASDVYGDTMLRTYMAIWLIIGFIAYIYRTLLGRILIRRSFYTVSAVQVANEKTTHLHLKPVSRPIDFLPGQFIFVKFIGADNAGIPAEVHPFSIASCPDETVKSLRIFVKALGDFTSSLKNMKVGTRVEIEGAFGSFVPQRYSARAQIWIAGGIGVTPFLSSARSLKPDASSVALFYSVQTKSELLDQALLQDYLPKNFSQFSYYPFVSEEQNNLLTATYINERVSVVDKDIFICGPPKMMRSLREQFRAMGVPSHCIHSEEFALQ